MAFVSRNRSGKLICLKRDGKFVCTMATVCFFM
jgi:hypothetical protein